MTKKVIVGMSPQFYEWVKTLDNMVLDLNAHLDKMPGVRATTTVIEEDDQE
jgi:hypothetical protein